MTTATIILLITLFAATAAFVVGFKLVHSNLKKVNLIKQEKFHLEEWGTCLVFAVIFSAVWVVVINIFYGIGDPTSISGIRFIEFMIIFLVIMLFSFPIYNFMVLTRPTSDATTHFDKMIEEKFLDRYQGKISYLFSFIIFFLIYLLPVVFLFLLLERSFIVMLYLWFVFIPLIFLSSFSASGQVANIITSTYTHKHHIDPKEERFLTEKVELTSFRQGILRVFNFILVIIAWVPFLTGFYIIYNSINRAIIHGGATMAVDYNIGFGIDDWIDLIVLIIQVIFAIRGFFTKYWKKKSKTKTIDFMFSAWIFIAISMNILMNFSVNQPEILNTLLSNPILEPLKNLFSDQMITLPLISIQGFIMVFYGGYLLFHKNSDFHADLKINAINKSFGLKNVHEFQKVQQNNIFKRTKIKDVDLLVKSALLTPIFGKHGIDLNKNIRRKATQYLYLAAFDDKSIAKKIVDTISKNTIEYQDSKMSHLSFFAKISEHFKRLLIKLNIRMDLQLIYFSEEAVDLLGKIGSRYDDLVLDRMINAMESAEPQLKRSIFKALAHIGGNKKNLPQILEKFYPFMISKSYDYRKRANQAIIDMILKGNYSDPKFVEIILQYLYKILENQILKEKIIESVMDTLFILTSKIPKKIDIKKIYPFLHYEKNHKQEFSDKTTLDFITQYSILIVGYCVYYNLESFPYDDILSYLENPKSYIRYVATDAIGNYILMKESKSNPDHIRSMKEKVISKLIEISLFDKDEDVRDMANESIAEFIIMNKNKDFDVISIEGNPIDIIDYYISHLEEGSKQIQNNASESLKVIAPIINKDIYKIIINHIQGENLEVRRDLLVTLGLLTKDIHNQVDLSIISRYLADKDVNVRENAIFCFGMIGMHRPEDIDLNTIIKCLEDPYLSVRLQVIFALGKIGRNRENANLITEILINKFFNIDRRKFENVYETELYGESLGQIGATHPSNEIIICLQQSLMGDSHVHVKDVISKALYAIGEGMIERGNAKRMIKNTSFYNEISWLKISKRYEYSLGNIILMLIDAIQMRKIPLIVMREISDSLQDLMPAFLFVKQKKENELLLKIKELLQQAYYSNYHQEILVTIDRIDSLLSFKAYFGTDIEILKEYALFFSKSYTPDGKQFYDQGMLFLLKENEPNYIHYALKSFEIAIDLAPNEYFSPECYLEMGKIYKKMKEYAKSDENLNRALQSFASLDNVAKMKETREEIHKLKENSSL